MFRGTGLVATLPPSLQEQLVLSFVSVQFVPKLQVQSAKKAGKGNAAGKAG